MKSQLCKKLSLINLKNNKKTYAPYILAQVVIIAMFYNIASLTVSEGIEKIKGASDLQIMLALGTILIGMFSIVFSFYTNSFLMKQRKKDLGLFTILGMEKKHTYKIVRYETRLLYILTLIAGLIVGILFSGLIYAVLLNIIGAAVTLEFSVSLIGIIATVIVFTFIFILVLIHNLRQVAKVTPRELLQSKNVGETAPKSNKAVVIIGFITLAIGYVIALTIKNILVSIPIFFVASIFVIIGTYSLFTSGSIWALKKIQANKNKYYTPKYFTAVSGLIYRMKQNAVGLASICVLSTMITVTLSVTLSTFCGQEQAINTMYPADVVVTMYKSTDKANDTEYIREQAEETAEKCGVEIVSLETIKEDNNPIYDSAVAINLKGDNSQKNNFANKIKLNDDSSKFTYQSAYAVSKYSDYDGAPAYRATYGGLFFLGIFLGTIFLMGTVLIIYYKQISEGYEDRERFRIMKKVGMSESECKDTIKTQVTMVFFLPPVAAAIHTLFAFKAMKQICMLLSINLLTVIICTIATLVVFFAIYIGVYVMTSKRYFEIVNK